MTFVFLLILVYIVSGREKTLWCSFPHFWRTRLVLFLSNNVKNATHEGSNGWKSVCFPPESVFFVFTVNMIKVFFPICTLTCRVNNYTSNQGRSKSRRNVSTIFIMNFCIPLNKFHWIKLSYPIDCHWLELFSFERKNYSFVELKICFENINK